MSDITLVSANELQCGRKSYRCTIGANGFTDHHMEGGKTTPIGTFALRACWYRHDRLKPPATKLTLHTIEPDDGWCDDAASTDYNLPVKLPMSASCEQLWRSDHIYDIIVPMGYNDAPIIPGRGSAIFFHLTEDYRPTLGCVAVSLKDMLEILPKLTSSSRMVVTPQA